MGFAYDHERYSRVSRGCRSRKASDLVPERIVEYGVGAEEQDIAVTQSFREFVIRYGQCAAPGSPCGSKENDAFATRVRFGADDIQLFPLPLCVLKRPQRTARIRQRRDCPIRFQEFPCAFGRPSHRVTPSVGPASDRIMHVPAQRLISIIRVKCLAHHGVE